MSFIATCMRSGEIVLAGDVAGDSDAADLVRQRPQRIDVAARHDDACAFRGESACDHLSHIVPARSADHDRDLVVQLSHTASLP